MSYKTLNDIKEDNYKYIFEVEGLFIEGAYTIYNIEKNENQNVLFIPGEPNRSFGFHDKFYETRYPYSSYCFTEFIDFYKDHFEKITVRRFLKEFPNDRFDYLFNILPYSECNPDSDDYAMSTYRDEEFVFGLITFNVPEEKFYISGYYRRDEYSAYIFENVLDLYSELLNSKQIDKNSLNDLNNIYKKEKKEILSRISFLKSVKKTIQSIIGSNIKVDYRYSSKFYEEISVYFTKNKLPFEVNVSEYNHSTLSLGINSKSESEKYTINPFERHNLDEFNFNLIIRV